MPRDTRDYFNFTLLHRQFKFLTSCQSDIANIIFNQLGYLATVVANHQWTPWQHLARSTYSAQPWFKSSMLCNWLSNSSPLLFEENHLSTQRHNRRVIRSLFCKSLSNLEHWALIDDLPIHAHSILTPHERIRPISRPDVFERFCIPIRLVEELWYPNRMAIWTWTSALKCTGGRIRHVSWMVRTIEILPVLALAEY